jgi:hypothetical protein
MKNKQLDPVAIEKQAKAIMDGFLKELGTIPEPKEFGLRREHQKREATPHPTDERFRQLFFENARAIEPKKVNDNNELVMERKQW